MIPRWIQTAALLAVTVLAMAAVAYCTAHHFFRTAFDGLLGRLPPPSAPRPIALSSLLVGIPRVIYVCNKTKEAVPRATVEAWLRLNPGYTVEVFGDAECEAYLRKTHGAAAARAFRQIPNGPIKADLWRAFILYERGGVYVDVDMMPLQPLSAAIPRGATFVVSGSGVFWTTVNPCLIATVPKNPILLDVLRLFGGVIRGDRGERYGYWQFSIVLMMTRALQSYVPALNNKVKTVRVGGNHVIHFLRERVTKVAGIPSACSGPGCTSSDYIVGERGLRLFKTRADNYDRFTHAFVE